MEELRKEDLASKCADIKNTDKLKMKKKTWTEILDSKDFIETHRIEPIVYFVIL